MTRTIFKWTVSCLAVMTPLMQQRSIADSEPVDVSFYECAKCATPPTLDGKLDDLCWQGLPPMENFYQYWSPTPKPPPLKTAARVCYDDSALYLGITLFDDKVDRIKANIKNRDNPETWSDDCVEIMFDPHISGTGYFKFTTNFLCARYDEKVTDMVMDAGWNAEGWEVTTSKDGSAWYIEASFPWSDFGAQPKDGDFWAFDLVRYGYSSGSFRGVTWSLGGNYASPQNFGYLGFGGFSPPTKDGLDRMSTAFSKTKTQYFRLLLPDLVLIHEATGGWSKSDLRSWLSDALEATARTVAEARTAVAGVPEGSDRTRLDANYRETSALLDELQSKFQRSQPLAPSTAMFLRENALALRQRADELKWEGLLFALVSSQ